VKQPGADLIDVQEAAIMVGRNPETVRRWVWSGRLRARKIARRLMIERLELDALIRLGPEGRPGTLAEWLTEMEDVHGTSPRRRSSAADLVIEDRTRRSTEAVRRARR
jgi:hypothetical protein